MAEFNPQLLDAAQDVLMDLKAKAKQAEEKGDVLTFGLMNELIKVVSPIVTKAHARLLREEKANFNAGYKALRAKFREDGAKNRDDLPHLKRD